MPLGIATPGQPNISSAVGPIVVVKLQSSRSSLSSSVSVSPFFIAKTQQQPFKLIKCLLVIGPDRLEDETVAAIQVGAKHFQYAGGPEILLAFANLQIVIVLLNP